MTKQTVKLANALSVTFSSEVLEQHSYVPKDSACGSCGGGCATKAQCPSHALTVHLVPDGILVCESTQDPRTLRARYVVTDDDGRGDNVALRAFKDDVELLSWIATIGHELADLKANLEARFTPSFNN